MGIEQLCFQAPRFGNRQVNWAVTSLFRRLLRPVIDPRDAWIENRLRLFIPLLSNARIATWCLVKGNLYIMNGIVLHTFYQSINNALHSYYIMIAA